MRLVDADYIKESVKRQCDNCRKEGMKWMSDIVERAIIEELDSTPTAQQERKKGKWIEHNPHKWGLGIIYECSECGYEMDCEEPNYCPSCGADMRGSNT